MPQALTPHAALRLQRMVGNQAVSRLVSTLQRKPVQKDADTWSDDKHPDVTLAKMSTCVYKITTGPMKDTVIYWEGGDEWYNVFDPAAKYPEFNEDSPFDWSTASATVTADTSFRNIGRLGKGVRHVGAATKLHTAGLNTCVGWCLYNADSAYLTHIVVDAEDATTVLEDGIQAQVDALRQQFVDEAGSAPTGLTIVYDREGQPAYTNNTAGVGKLAWMAKLKPSAGPTFAVQYATHFETVVQPSGNEGARREWTGAAITLKYRQPDASSSNASGESK